MCLPESEQEKIMEEKDTTLISKIEHLDRLVDLYSKIKSDKSDYIRKNDVMQHLEWAMSHIADSIWQESHTL